VKSPVEHRPATMRAADWLRARLQAGSEWRARLLKEGRAMSPAIRPRDQYAARDLLGIEEGEAYGPGGIVNTWELPSAK